MLSTITLVLYLIPMLVITIYAGVQLSLILNQIKYKKPIASEPREWPIVTIQLPIYNEIYVVERLIDAVCRINYPKEKLEIQILDDSTDETSGIISNHITSYKEAGFDIKHIQRTDRTGYKAGALKEGLATCKGTYIAIFDADFLPSSLFLKKTISYFQNKEVGVVQTRWGHLNEKYSLLTRLQAFGLNAHFFIEQTGRSAGGHYINFNGTAGVWRKDTIADAGGWSADTITEDLDLSYRAQLKGWQFIYLEDVISPAELPVTMPAIRSQQYRWMKGGAECFKKNTGSIIKAKIPFNTKLHGVFHLMNSSVFVFVFLVGLLSSLLTIFPQLMQNSSSWLKFTVIFQVNWIILGAFYWLAFRKNGKSFFVFVGRFFWFLTYMLGLSLHNTLAVIEGWMGKKTPFVRTPKFNVNQTQDSWQTNTYRIKNLNRITYFEMSLSLLFLVCLGLDIMRGYWGMIPFHGMCFLGYTLVVFYTLKHTFSK